MSKTLTLSAFNEMKKIFETSLQKLAPEEDETKHTKGKVDAFALRANASIFIPRDHLVAAMVQPNLLFCSTCPSLDF